MLYMVYLVSLALCLAWGISWNKMLFFVDAASLEFVIVPCFLVLLCTGSLAAFARALWAAVGRQEYSDMQRRESLCSVKMVMLAAVISGAAGTLIGLVNGFCTMDYSYEDSFQIACLNTSVAMLTLFYALVICMILLPVRFRLEKKSG